MTDIVPSNQSPQQQFEERIRDRLRADIGNLMPDEVLSKMIEDSLERLLMKERPQPSTGFYSSTPPPKPPLIQEIVSELLMPAVREEVKEWIATHQTEMEGIIVTQLQKSFAEAVAAAISSVFYNNYSQLSAGLQQTVMDLQRRAH